MKYYMVQIDEVAGDEFRGVVADATCVEDAMAGFGGTADAFTEAEFANRYAERPASCRRGDSLTRRDG